MNLARIKELLGQSLDPTAEPVGPRRGAGARARHHRGPAAARPQSRDGGHAPHRRPRCVAARSREPLAQRRIRRPARGCDRRHRVLHGDAAGRPRRSLVHARQRRALPRGARRTASASGAAARAEPQPAPPPPAARPAPLAARDATERRAAVDPELLALFIEEAGEEIATIGRLFPLWEENPSDRESLTRVRRAFHTLKGSGRVVGARRIGDFAWSVENLLNRVIDGTLDRSARMLATLKEAIAALPALVGELEGRASEVAGLDALAARARGPCGRPGGAGRPRRQQRRRRSRRSCSSSPACSRRPSASISPT